MTKRPTKKRERAPQYADIKDCPHNHLYRVVSRPNGLWRAERRVAKHGTDTRDNWEAIAGDTADYKAACNLRDVWAIRNGPPPRSGGLLPENVFS